MSTAHEDWRGRAACRDEDPELFFPVGNSGPALDQIAEAKAVCHRCPVASACLAWALETGQDDGVWGGWSEDERREESRARNQRPPRKTQKGKKTDLTQLNIELVLARLDVGVHLPEVERETGIGQEVCRRIWRLHRDTPNPPRRSNSVQAIAKRAGRSRYGRAAGGNRPRAVSS